MMPKAHEFPFVQGDPSRGAASALPYIPVVLELGSTQQQVSALVDSGAAINVLPFDAGASLGADWDAQQTPVPLSGVLAGTEARALVVNGVVADFPSVRLAFAWTRRNDIPVILGQVNFFMEFDVCIRRSRSVIEVIPSR